MTKKKDQTITHDEWIREFLVPLNIVRPPNSFTVEEAMKATNRKRSTVVRMLQEMVDKGELSRQKICIDGRHVSCFSPKNKKGE